MKVLIKISNNLINDKDIDTNGFAVGVMKAINEQTGLMPDRSTMKLNKDLYSSTATIELKKDIGIQNKLSNNHLNICHE